MNTDDPVANILELMEAPEWRGVYVLGCFGRYITVYSQQVRALNLIYSLLKSGRLTSNSEVAVVGAGIGGLTAAVGAARVNVKVTVLERLSRPMGIQKGSTQRFLHPHIYDWPSMELDGEAAGLPFFDWSAASADSVVDQIEREWNKELKRYGPKLVAHWDVSEVAIERLETEKQIGVTWNDSEGPHGETFDCVILAVGFGSEPDVLGSQHGYWEDDRLTKISEKIKSCLVSGSGDGGLTDVMQLCIRDFQHDKIVRMFADDPKSRQTADELLKLEASHHGKDNKVILQYYQKLDAKPVQDSLRTVLRSDTKVYLTGRSLWQVYAPNSSILNRFIISQLARLKAWNWIPGPIHMPPVLKDNKYVVSFGKEGKKQNTYDILVMRHGPTSVLKKEFPEIFDACDDLAKRWKSQPQLDSTRKRLAWEDVFDLPIDEFTTEQTERFKVVAFDLDGTLLHGKGYVWSWPLVWRYLKYEDGLRRKLFNEYVHNKSKTNRLWYKEWCDHSARLFRERGLTRNDFVEITKDLTPVEGLLETITALKQSGMKLAIVSGGIDVFLEEVIPNYKELFDYVYINKFRFNEQGVFEGVTATRYDFDGKATAVEEICAREGLSTDQAVFVGDGFNDAAVLGKVGRTIAFLPSSADMKNAYAIVEEPDLRKILPYILGQAEVPAGKAETAARDAGNAP
jgi:HAD superfamily phosphoserine phosphatase-like hydrolase